MAKKIGRYYLDWWNIRKSTIYAIVGVVLAAVLLVLGIWVGERNNWFIPEDTSSFPGDAARIIFFEGEVRITRAATRDTILVTKETYAAPGDIIQTMADGRALIQMTDGTRYQLRPNGALTIKDNSSLFGSKNVRVLLDDGQLNVRTDEQPQDVNNIVEIAQSENRLLSDTDASFNADRSTGSGEIRISRGGVETTIGSQKTTIRENEFATLSGGKITAREKLFEAPGPLAPGNGSQIGDAGGQGAIVTLIWQDAEGFPALSYYLQVSRSPTFAQDAIMVDRSGMTSREYRLGGLSPGNYYWRLKATARSGQTTNWHDAWKFTVIRGGDNIAIEASEWKVEPVGGNIYLISGRTKPGMSVRSLGREAFAGSDGSFRLQIFSPSIETAVEIGDDRGNRSGFIISLRNGNILRKY
jgi:hypothetical protein